MIQTHVEARDYCVHVLDFAGADGQTRASIKHRITDATKGMVLFKSNAERDKAADWDRQNCVVTYRLPIEPVAFRAKILATWAPSASRYVPTR